MTETLIFSTGSVVTSGSLVSTASISILNLDEVSGSFTGSITGGLEGTSSVALALVGGGGTVSASHALRADVADSGTGSFTGSFVGEFTGSNSFTGSFTGGLDGTATTASFALAVAPTVESGQSGVPETVDGVTFGFTDFSEFATGSGLPSGITEFGIGTSSPTSVSIEIDPEEGKYFKMTGHGSIGGYAFGLDAFDQITANGELLARVYYNSVGEFDWSGGPVFSLSGFDGKPDPTDLSYVGGLMDRVISNQINVHANQVLSGSIGTPITAAQQETAQNPAWMWFRVRRNPNVAVPSRDDMQVTAWFGAIEDEPVSVDGSTTIVTPSNRILGAMGWAAVFTTAEQRISYLAFSTDATASAPPIPATGPSGDFSGSFSGSVTGTFVGELEATGTLTGTLIGSASHADFSETSSFALNAGGGGGGSSFTYFDVDAPIEPTNSFNDEFNEVGVLDLTKWQDFNTGSVSASLRGDGLLRLTNNLVGVGGQHIWTQPIPSGSWAIRTKLQFQTFATGTQQFVGLVLQNQNNDRIEVFELANDASQQGRWLIVYTNPTTFSSTINIKTLTDKEMLETYYFQIEFDGANIAYKMSRNGIGFDAAFDTPLLRTTASWLQDLTHVGFAVAQGDTDFSASLQWIRIATGSDGQEFLNGGLRTIGTG